MTTFAIHQKGFVYTDDAVEPAEEIRGSIVATYDSLEKARAAKYEADLQRLQNLAGKNVVDFFFYSKSFDIIYQQLCDYYEAEYGQTLSDKYRVSFPKNVSRQQAERLLQILGVSFHDVVEYTA